MIKRFYLIIVVLVIGILLSVPNKSIAQVAPADTICISVEDAREVQNRIRTLETRDSLNSVIIEELETQESLYQRRVNLLEQQLDLKEQEFELFKQKVNYSTLEKEREQFERRRWYYTAGGTVVGVLVGIFAFN